MKLTQAIGKRVSDLLAERGYLQYELYKLGGVPRSMVCALLTLKE